MEQFASGWKHHYYGKGDVIVYRLNRDGKEIFDHCRFFGADFMVRLDDHIGYEMAIGIFEWVQLDRLIRLDGGLHEGLSGAPVADAGGLVIGIATSALSRSYGMVVPASTVNRVVDALLTKGHVSRAFLGIGAQPVDVPGEEQGGLLITGLVPGGPAQAAGMLVGDILVRVDGQPASSLQALRQALADKVGEAVKATVHRGGVPTELTLTVAQWPTEKRHHC